MSISLFLVIRYESLDFFFFFFWVKLAEDIKPHPMVISFLTKLTRFIPTWKIVPSNDIIDVAFKETHIRKQVTYLIIIILV